MDGKALAESLIQSGAGMLTPYGLFFRNGMRMENLYQGQGFPPYLWGERQAELSYLSNRLLTQGNTVATLDELHVWLSNRVVIEYIRNILKRARKRDSSMVLASQNLEDFLLPGVAELTKPLFAIPTHQFLFNAGAIDKKLYMDTLQLEESEFELIRYPQRGTCLYKCGNERYLLEVHAPKRKEALFGTAGGR